MDDDLLLTALEVGAYLVLGFFQLLAVYSFVIYSFSIDLGFSKGKSMSLFSREGHLGIHVVKFPGGESGLMDALRLAEHFEKQNWGRKEWARVQSSTFNKEDDNNPNLVQLDAKTGEKMRILYGHLATVSDLDKVTFEIKKKVTIESRREYNKLFK
ncbi:XS domain-containing protein/XS zinc finger domain-containing protein-related [Abeliophyllum distichum]|uniref:XS domain-containing protein/XS zinc finger domain-containing protein-related n=1 Tax=Abeliophyllum distichum TaxID=126358 RepID=A0ABD1RF48_9LAMI